MREYKKMDGLNQSCLKKLIIHPSDFLEAKENMSQESTEDHFVFGNVLDTLMYNYKNFDKTYAIAKVPPISDGMKIIAKSIMDTMELEGVKFLDPDSPACRKIILEACELNSYQPRWKDETKINRVVTDQVPQYINFYIKNSDKIVISSEVYDKAQICRASLLSDPYISKYFRNIEPEFKIDESKDVQIFSHVALQFKYSESITLKCELDEVIINHKTKQIIPADLKSIGTSVASFPYNFWKLRYDFQSAFYSDALKKDSRIEELLHKGYTLEDFRFIVAETNSKRCPLIYKVPANVLSIGRSGGTLSNGRKLEGYQKALDAYEYHTEKDNWNYPAEYLESNFISIEI